MEFLIGILCGILLSVLLGFGPSFFGLIQSSVQYGFRRASAFVVGVFVSDLLLVLAMLVLLKDVDFDTMLQNIWVATIGGACLIAFGIYSFCKHVKPASGKRGKLKFRTVDNPSVLRLMGHGFLLNLLNPMVWIYWVSVVSLLSGEMGLTATARFVFFAGLLLSLFGCDLLKCRLASLLQTWFTAFRLNMFNKVLGGILIAFGIYFIVSRMVVHFNPEVDHVESGTQKQSTQIIQSLHQRMAKDSAKHADTLYVREDGAGGAGR
ncbi:MAG: LysE family transporter [Bacteroidales bacterium]|nr:LysE family transporter [Bacteroidales bacterium]